MQAPLVRERGRLVRITTIWLSVPGSAASSRQEAMSNHTQKGIHSRGYLPHIDGAEFQVITYRLNDALPKAVIDRLRDLPDTQRRQHTEQAMDAGYGHCWLAIPEVAALVVENWFYFHGTRYQLIAWVVMPNHVHLLIRVLNGESLSRIVHSWKSYTGKKISALLTGSPPSIWQPDYWDRYIRNEAHFQRAIEYIHQNPVKAGLVKNAEDWRWSSANAGGPPALPGML
ncbi:transposase [Oceanobacter sp. 5_MG-2023]|nr:transposase [Oceanobacter sp. 5_MG-2023]